MSSAATTGERNGAGGIRRFDFRRSNKLNRDHLRALQIVHETVASQSATILSSRLRVVASMAVRSVTEMSYEQFLRDSPNPTHMCITAFEPWPGEAVVSVPVGEALIIVDLLLGGQGRPAGFERPLTEIESGLVRTVLDRILEEFAPAFAVGASPAPRVVAEESNPQFVQVAGATDLFVVVTFDLRLGDNDAAPVPLTVAYPYTMLQPLLGELLARLGQRSGGGRRSNLERETLARSITGVSVDLSIRFPAVHLSGRDLLNLEPGQIIPLSVGPGDALEARVSDVPVLEVQPTRVGRQLAVKVVGQAAGLNHLLHETHGVTP